MVIAVPSSLMLPSCLASQLERAMPSMPQKALAPEGYELASLVFVVPSLSKGTWWFKRGVGTG